MTARRPEYTRPYSAEYLHASGRPVTRMFALRKIVHHMLTYSAFPKSHHCPIYIGCTPGFLRNHIESLFKPGMSWANYGEWHVDHIVPLSWFPFDKDPNLLFVASHWSNLQPLWGSENHKKGNRRDT